MIKLSRGKQSDNEQNLEKKIKKRKKEKEKTKK